MHRRPAADNFDYVRFTFTGLVDTSFVTSRRLTNRRSVVRPFQLARASDD